MEIYCLQLQSRAEPKWKNEVSNYTSMRLWEPSMGTSHRLPKSVSKQQPDKQNFHGNQLSQQYINCCERCLHLGRPQDINRDIREDASVSQMTRASQQIAVEQCCSRSTFWKSQCNQRQEQVGEDFSGKQPDQLTLWFHRASLNSTPQWRATLPAVFQAATPSADFNYKSPGRRNQQPTSNIKSSASSSALCKWLPALPQN
jgi:hypothetical protein